MKLLNSSRNLLLVLCFFLAACAGESKGSGLDSSTAVSPLSASPTATIEQVESAALPAFPASPTPLQVASVAAAQPTQTPPPKPSNTPQPLITLSVPDSWQDQAQAAVDQLNRSSTQYTWSLVDHDQASIKLVNDSSGMLIQETSIALAVPFTQDWEGVSTDRAKEIVSNGHESVTVLPWSEMTAGQKALRINGLGPADSGYPLRDTWSLVADPHLNEALEDLAPLLQEGHQDNVVHLAAVGDIMLDRSLGDYLRQGDLLYPFSGVAEQIQGADISVGNLESALGDTGVPEIKSYTFRAPPEAAASLKLAGFDIVSLANNHAMDYGEDALLQALTLLEEHGVGAIGAGKNSAEAHAPEIMEANGLKIAFFGYVNVPVEARSGFDTAAWTAGQETPGLAWADPQIIAADVAGIRDQVDLVVVLLHSGYEYVPAPSEAQQEAAHTAIDAGADLVVGHHAHILQGLEFSKDGLIIYGTANFAFVIDGPPETAIFHVWLDRDGVREVAIEPAVVQSGGRPRLADNLEAPAIHQQIYYLTNLLNAR